MPDTDALATGLAAALARALGPVEVADLERLTGGASRETWAFSAGGVDFVLRRDPPGRRGVDGAMRREADIMRACAANALAVPEVVVDDDGTLLGTAGLVMRRVPGETLARRILRDDDYARARTTLVATLGGFLAGLHALDPAVVPGAPTPDPLAVWDRAPDAARANPVLVRTHDWLDAHRPPTRHDVLVHGDFRLGNLIVGSDGLRAVIDWELIHRGDPLEDLAWLSLKAWRFGAPLEVAGLGTLDELIAAYAAAGGEPVDRDRLHWWTVAKTFTWAIGCVIQADLHLTGRVRSLDLATVGRRVAEQEWDLIELLAPDACTEALGAPLPETVPDDAGFGRPSARQLVEAVREFLADEVVGSSDRSLTYPARVAVTALGLVERELAQSVVVRAGDDWRTLALAVRDRLLVAAPHHLPTGHDRPGRTRP